MNEKKIINLANRQERINKSNFNRSQENVKTCNYEGGNRNTVRENKIKEIFSSQGLIGSSMNDNSMANPVKNQNKITSKEFGNAIQETRLGNENSKKYRRNSAHNFSNLSKSGFYMSWFFIYNEELYLFIL